MGRDNKILLAIGAATLAIIGFGAYFLSKPPKPVEQVSSTKVDSKLLIRSNSNIKKAPNEKAVLVEFGDFQCPACGSYAPLVNQVLSEFKDELTFVARHFPLPQHKNALSSAYAAEAAGRQGKFWEMYDVLYKNQNEWENLSKPNEIFEKYAKDFGLDLDKFKSDMNLNEIKDKVQNDASDGDALKVNSTPTFFLNGSFLKAPRSLDEFKSIISSAIKDNQNVLSTEDEKDYHAHFDLLVMLEGKAFDFSSEKYQTDKSKKLSESVHLHDGNGQVVHFHAKDIKLSEYFNSLKFGFNESCFITDTGKKYCSDKSKLLRMFVNGKENKEFGDYKPVDLDRILITYGSDSVDALQKQINSVSDKACIYSEKCPERGPAPTEDCVGGLGTGCEVE